MTVEYPVNLINLNEEDAEFQVCTGPVLLPDLATWRREAAGARVPGARRLPPRSTTWSSFCAGRWRPRRSERRWLDLPRGRDRFELIDPAVSPPGHPPRRPRPYAYNEVWELPAENAILAAANDAPRR